MRWLAPSYGEGSCVRLVRPAQFYGTLESRFLSASFFLIPPLPSDCDGWHSPLRQDKFGPATRLTKIGASVF